MRPSFTSFDTGNGTFTNAIFCRDNSLQTAICANCNNLLGSQFGRCATLTAITCAMFYAISLISGSGIPSEIAKVVILWISVVMAALMLFWWSANEGKKHKPMDFHKFALVALPKKNVQPSIFGMRGWDFHMTSFNRPHLTMIGHFIQSFKSKNGLPSLNHINLRIIDIGIIPLNNMECQ